MTLRPHLLFGAAFLGSGAALVIYVVAGISLFAAVSLLAAGGVALAAFIWARSSEAGRSRLRSRVAAGLIAGVLATTSYDVARLILVRLAGFKFWPFDIFHIFGQALLGAGHTGIWVTVAGTAYHIANGIGFSIAYTVWCGRRGIVAGVIWAMALEVCMVSIYPGWLGLKALDEFLQVSIFGHVVFGTVLGLVSKVLLERWEAPS